jgi:hypothetical protein
MVLLVICVILSVCQLLADDGKDLGKWQRSSIKHLFIVDNNKQIEIAEKSWTGLY